MENKTSKRIKWLVGVLLVLFFVVVVIDGAPSFVAGFKAGSESVIDEPAIFTGDVRLVTAVTQPTDSDATTLTFADGTTLRRIQSIDALMVPIEEGEDPLWAKILRILFTVLYFGAGVSFMVHIVLFAVSFPSRHIMDPVNIVSLRWISGSLVVMTLGYYAVALMEYVWLQSHVVLEGYRITFPSPPAGIVVALILVVLTEILNLAGRLQTEQDLTI
jgi:hypothetical protein